MRRILFGVFIVFFLILVGLYLGRAPLLKMAIHNIGTAVVQTNVSVQGVVFKPFEGYLVLKGLEVSNPEGYSKNNAVDITEIRVRLTPSSLLTGPIQIQEITVSEPKIRMEGGLKTNNLTALQANLPQEEQPAAVAPTKVDTKARPVEIDTLTITDGRVTMTAPVAITANLGTITIRDIGKEGSDTKISDVFALVLSNIAGSGRKVLTSELGQKGRAALEGAQGKAEKTVKKIGKKLKSFFGQ